MYSFRKIFLVTLWVIFFAVFALGGPPLSAQQSSSSQLLTVAVLPFEADWNPKKYRFVGWGLHYLISSRLQNLPGIYCLSAEEVVNIYLSTIKIESKTGKKESENGDGVLEPIQKSFRYPEIMTKISNAFDVDILIYGKYNAEEIEKISFKLWAKRGGYKVPDEFDFKNDLAKENVFAVLMDRIIKLIQLVSDGQNEVFDRFYRTYNQENNPIFDNLPDYQAKMLFDKTEAEYKQFRVYSESWNGYATAIRKKDKCDTFEKNWKDEIKADDDDSKDEKRLPSIQEKKSSDKGKKILTLNRKVDGLVLNAHIQLHNMQLGIMTDEDEFYHFKNALQANPRMVAAQLGQIKILWEMRKLRQIRDLIESITPPESNYPWFEVYNIALAANEQWDKSNLADMEAAIAKLAHWLPLEKAGFSSIHQWAGAMLAKLLAELGKITDMGNVFGKIEVDDMLVDSIGLSFLLAEMYMRRGEYIVAYRHYKNSHFLLQKRDENSFDRKRHITYFNRWLFDPDFLEKKLKRCRHVLYKKRLSGSGYFRKFYQKYGSERQLVESITALAQGQNFRSIYAGTNRLNLYRLRSHNDRFEKAIIKGRSLLDCYVKQGGDVALFDPNENKIKFLQFDKKGNLWIATTQSGIFRWKDPELKNCFIRSCKASQDAKDLERIISFLIDDERETIWIAPSRGAMKKCNYEEDNSCLECESTNINSGRYTSIFKDSFERIFTTNDQGVYNYDFSQNKFVELFNKEDFGGESIIKATMYPKGTDNQKDGKAALHPKGTDEQKITSLWIITGNILDSSYGQWLATVDRNGKKYEDPTLQDSLKPPSGPAVQGFIIEKILPDPRGGLWIGTQKEGLLNVKDETVFDYNEFLFDGEDVYDLLWDNGLLWIASQNGVRRFNFDTVMSYFKQDGLPGNLVYVIDRSKAGIAYVGTSDGLAVYRNELFSLFEKWPINDNEGNKTRGIYGLMYDSKSGLLWCRGENWLHNYPVSNSGIPEGEGHPVKLKDQFSPQKKEIRMEIVADSNNKGVWINTSIGLSFVHNDRLTEKQVINLAELASRETAPVIDSDQTQASRPTAPVIDPDQSLWFAFDDAIYHINKEDIKHLLGDTLNKKDIQNLLRSSRIKIEQDIFNNAFGNRSFGNFYVNLIRIRPNGDNKGIWLGTSAGVIEYQPGSKKFKLKNKELGFGDIPVMVTALEFKDNASLWIGSNQGLLRYDFNSQQSSLYDHQYGLQNIFIHSIGFFDEDRIWVGTDEGLASLRLRAVKPLILESKQISQSGGDVVFELTPAFFREAHKDLRYQVENINTGDEFWVCPSHYPSSNNTREKPEYSLSDNRLSIKGLSPGEYKFSIRALSREFQLTPIKRTHLLLPVKIPSPFYMQARFFVLIGLLILFLSLAFYLNTQHARKRFGTRWAAMICSRKMRKSQETFIFIIYTIFQKSDTPEKILEYIRTQTAAGKDKNLAGLIQNYLYLLKLPNALHNLSRLLKKAQHMKWSQDIGNLYHIIYEMLKKDSMADIVELQLRFDANQSRLESSVSDGVDIPEFISIDIIKQLVLLDKTLSILAQIASESDYKHQWYYLTAADKILRDILAGSIQAENCPEKYVIISIAKQYASIVQKEMNRVIAIESKIREDITGRQIIRHLVENEYPAPIAYLYTRAQREDNPVIKADYELDLLSVLVRLLTYMVITDYVSKPKMEDRKDLSSLAQKPFSDGEWNGIFRDIVATLGATRQNHSIPEIYEEFSQKQSIQLLSDLIALRNNIVHRRRRDIQTLSTFNESLTHLLEKLHFFKDLNLLIVRKISTDEGPFNHIEFLKARGDILNLSTIKVTTGVSLSEHRVVVHNPLQGRIINLYPFLRYDPCALCKDHHIYYFSDVSGNRARYLSASTDCINESKAYQNELAEYLNPTSEIEAWIEYHVFKEEKEHNRA